MDEQKPGRRIVSRGEYVGQIAEKSLLSLSSVGLAIAGCVPLLIGGFFLILAICRSYSSLPGGEIHGADLPDYLAYGLMAICVGSVLVCGSIFAGKRAGKVHVGVLSTHANTADLPAQKTLVRASAEPVEQQQAVLLRAASQSDTTPAEQLVRPAGGNGE